MNQDNYRTPLELFEKIVDLWGLGIPYLDVCATNNKVKIPYCKNYIDPEYNAIHKDTNWYNPVKLAWGNFPHSKNKDFFLKAVEQLKKGQTRTIILLPLNCLSAKYFHDNIKYCQVKFLQGRIRFLDEEGNPSKYTSRNGYCTVLIA